MEFPSKPLDPQGPPEPVEDPSTFTGFEKWLIGGVAACGLVVTFMAASVPRLSGATRSARLKWQEREREIGQTVPERPAPEDRPPAENAP